jgi:hypothetical protein
MRDKITTKDITIKKLLYLDINLIIRKFTRNFKRSGKIKLLLLMLMHRHSWDLKGCL